MEDSRLAAKRNGLIGRGERKENHEADLRGTTEQSSCEEVIFGLFTVVFIEPRPLPGPLCSFPLNNTQCMR